MTTGKPEPDTGKIVDGLVELLSSGDQTMNPNRDILPILRSLDPRMFDLHSIELLAEAAYQRDPDLLLEIAKGLLRAPLDSLRHYVSVIERLDPDWFAAHEDSLNEILFGPMEPADWL